MVLVDFPHLRLLTAEQLVDFDDWWELEAHQHVAVLVEFEELQASLSVSKVMELENLVLHVP